MSFIVTHSRVISDWRGTDGLEENLWKDRENP